jgi:predicted DNA-binding transcriptional regulator AlpA
MKEKNKKHEMPEEAMITQAKAAEMCGMTRAAIHDLVNRGRLRSIEVEGRELVFRREVEAFERELG